MVAPAFGIQSMFQGGPLQTGAKYFLILHRAHFRGSPTVGPYIVRYSGLARWGTGPSFIVVHFYRCTPAVCLTIHRHCCSLITHSRRRTNPLQEDLAEPPGCQKPRPMASSSTVGGRRETSLRDGKGPCTPKQLDFELPPSGHLFVLLWLSRKQLHERRRD